jgi:hypothetical protein
VVQVQQRAGRRGGVRDLGGPVTIRNANGDVTARVRISRASRRTFRFRYQDMSSPDTKAVIR